VIFREKLEFEGTQFVDIKFEPTINGRPDLVIEAVEKTRARKLPLLIIETKRKVPYRDPRFDPYSIQVIKQAAGYANQMGAPYFATCNGEIMVVFETFTPGVPLIQRRLKQYKVFYEEEFARIVLKELVRFKLGVGKWLPLDDIFVERLRSFHRFITPFMYEALTEKLKEDKKFKKEYNNWLKSQMFEYSDKTNETIAEQMSYLLMNKIAFYKTLESQIVDVDLDKLEKIETKNGVEFSQRLQDKFQELTKKADYEGIFQTTILDSVPVPDKLTYHLNEFIEELGAYNLGRIKADVIGRVYEDLIPPDERHRLGQYYTPPPIVDLIVELCVKSPDDKVLDPGCGSGSFLVKTYHKLRDLKKKKNPFAKDEDLHQELLNQVYGIDINPFPTQLSSMNLAVRNLKVRSEHINLFPMDFFKVKPGMALVPKEFDVVITNPPYTRQEEMEYKDQIREAALTYSDGSKIEMGARAGIYAYFFTHSAKFLKNGGRMGYVTSTSWLEANFGKDLQKFFLNHFKILAIIGYEKRVFEKAAVNTCVVILEKADGKELIKERDINLTKFVKLKRKIKIEDVLGAIKPTGKDYETKDIKILVKKQGNLHRDTKWSKYLNAPTIYFKLLRNPKMIKLKEIADIRRGVTTGANPFFILDKQKADHWGIEKKYLKPCIKSTQEAKCLVFEEKDVKYYLLVVHADTEELRRRGHSNVLSYIEDGERKDYNKRRTTESRKIWYDLGELRPAPLLSTLNIWQRHLIIRNKVEVLATHNLYEIRPKNTDVLLGVLNSSLTELFMEIHGRVVLGEGALAIMVYEMKNLPILDPRKITKPNQKKINVILSKLADAQRKNEKDAEKKIRRALDKIIFDTLGLNRNEQKEIYEGLKSLKQMRLKRKEVDVLVETAEKWKPRKKAKRRKIVEEVPSKRLDTWMKD